MYIYIIYIYIYNIYIYIRQGLPKRDHKVVVSIRVSWRGIFEKKN